MGVGLSRTRCQRAGFYADAIVFRIKHGAWVIDLHIVSIAGRHGLVAAVLVVGSISWKKEKCLRARVGCAGCLDWLAEQM